MAANVFGGKSTSLLTTLMGRGPAPSVSKAPGAGDIKIGTTTIGGTVYNVYTDKSGQTFTGSPIGSSAGGAGGGFATASTFPSAPFQGNITDPKTGTVYSLETDAGKVLLQKYKASIAQPVSEKPAGTVIGTSTQAGIDYVTVSQGVGEKPKKVVASQGLQESLAIKTRNVAVSGAVIGQQEAKISSLEHQRAELLKVYQGQKRDWRNPGPTVSMPEVLGKIQAIDKELEQETGVRNKLVEGYRGKARIAERGYESLETYEKQKALSGLEKNVVEKYSADVPLEEMFGLEAQQAVIIGSQLKPVKPTTPLASEYFGIKTALGSYAGKAPYSSEGALGFFGLAKGEKESQLVLEERFGLFERTGRTRIKMLAEEGNIPGAFFETASLIGRKGVETLIPPSQQEFAGWLLPKEATPFISGFRGLVGAKTIKAGEQYSLLGSTREELISKGGFAGESLAGFAAFTVGGKAIEPVVAKALKPSKTVISEGEMFISSSADEKTYSLWLKGKAGKFLTPEELPFKYSERLQNLLTYGRTKTTPFEFPIAGGKLADFARPLEEMGFSARFASAKGGTKWIVEPKTSIQTLVTTKGEAPFGKGLYYSEPGVLKGSVEEALPYLKSNVFGGKIGLGKGKATEFFQTGAPVETSLSVRTMITPKGMQQRAMSFVDIKGQTGVNVLTEGTTGEAYTARLWQNIWGKSMPVKTGAKFGGKGFIGGTIEGKTPILLEPVKLEFLQATPTKTSIGFKVLGKGKKTPLSKAFGKDYLMPGYSLPKRVVRAIEVKLAGGPTGFVETTTTKTMPLLSGFKPSETIVPAVIQATKEINYSIPSSYAALAGGLSRVKVTPTEKLWRAEYRARYENRWFSPHYEKTFLQPTQNLYWETGRKTQQPFVSQTGIKEFDELLKETSQAETPFASFAESARKPIGMFEEYGAPSKQKLGEFLETKTGTGSKLLALTGLETGQAEKTNQELKNFLGTANLTALASRTSLASRLRTQQAEASRQAERTAQAQRTSVMQASKLGMATRTKQATRQATAQAFAFSEIPIPKTRTPPPPVLLPVQKAFPQASLKNLVQGFAVFAKRKGKLFRLTPEALPKLAAFSKGAKWAVGGAGASFYVKPVKGQVKASKAKEWLGLQKQFYKSKKGAFVERTKFRINTPGELKEITFAPRKPKIKIRQVASLKKMLLLNALKTKRRLSVL